MAGRVSSALCSPLRNKRGWIPGERLRRRSAGASAGAAFQASPRLHHLVLPVTMGAVGWVAWYSRFLRSSMLDVIHQDYIRTARAKGLTERRVMYRHALKNAAIPLVTIFALDLPYVFAGSLYVELIFSWPGMGLTLLQAVQNEDIPLAMGAMTCVGVFALFAHLFADVTYAFLDPRIRYQ